MSYANGNSGKAADIGLALARKCMPNERHPYKVVLGFHVGVIRIAITYHEARGGHSDQGGMKTAYFALVGDKAKEILDAFFDVEDAFESVEYIIESNRVTKMVATTALHENDTGLDAIYDMTKPEILGLFDVESRPSNED